MIEDVGPTIDPLDINPRFTEAASAGLAARLARLYSPEKIEVLQTLYEQLYQEAAGEDSEQVPLNISLGNNRGAAYT